eukprot:6197520-Pleurochrysis_carterae.AAC.5
MMRVSTQETTMYVVGPFPCCNIPYQTAYVSFAGSQYGGGVSVTDEASLTLTDCSIADCAVRAPRGGVLTVRPCRNRCFGSNDRGDIIQFRETEFECKMDFHARRVERLFGSAVQWCI